MSWILRTSVCTFRIVRHRDKFALYADDEFLQEAESANALADNVFTHTSEYDLWDLSDCDVEDSLSAWDFYK